MKDDLRRLDELAARLRETGLTEAEQGELDTLLQRQPEARRRFVDHLLLENDLRDDTAGLLGADVRTPSPGKVIAFRPAWLMPLGLAAALVLGVWLFWDQTPDSRTGPEIAQRQTPAKRVQRSVAVIRNTGDDEERAGTRAFHVGQVLYPGALNLASGILQLELYSGVSLVVEGPAELEIVSPDLVRMHSGKVRADVPPPARGFRLLAGEFDLVDLGTEFGVSLGKDGAGELHVINGEVQVKSAIAPGNAGELLTTGKAVALNRDGSHSVITADATKFAGSAALRERSDKRYAAWQKAMQALADDPDTVALYDFQMGHDNRLPNLAKHGPNDTEGIVVGCGKGQGRWEDKSSLDFRHSSQRVRVKIPGSYDSLTLATWVKIDSLEQFSQSLLQAESRQPLSTFWNLIQRKPNQGLRANFGDAVRHEDATKARHRHLTEAFILLPDRTGTWTHFAVTMDNATREVVHYANGREIERMKIDAPAPIEIGLADIGNSPSRNWAKGTKWEVRHLNGNMDEFLVSRRAFTAEEVHELFRAGRP